MGQNSRARRAAKQRKRQRSDPGRPSRHWSSAPQDAVDAAYSAIFYARQQRGLGVPVGQCARPLLAVPEDAIGRAVEMMVSDLLRALFAGGWTPVDLAEAAGRHLDADGTSYLLDGVVAATAEYPQQLVDSRWQGQLDELGGRMWWDRRRPQLPQWAARAGRNRSEALAMVIELLSLFERLPRLERVLPPPGTGATVGPAPSVDPARDRVLTKVRSLLAKAESTNSDDEAEALSAKAQELMTRYALDRALVDHTHGVRQRATLCRIWLDAPYVNAKAMVVDAVASANRCRAVLAGRWGYMTVVGDQGDLRMVELLTTSLLVQATRTLLSTGSHSRAGVSRTRSYRQSFLVAYAARIGERLRAANDVSAGATDAGRLLPVLSARSRAVDDLIEQRFPDLVAKEVSVSNTAGWSAGLGAAELALFDVFEALGESEPEDERPRRAG